ncbi:hypothetical protein [Tenuibacillus multivorans]|uniref:Uncharacterized protein n=1 Tax=Tenuibacillus multivorans TaxID=237069 RepID=A0A1G9Z5K0_9BACI|nr:hypothetical protein [Tenuibacillus multivorans]GEL77424.1 hypothetical protein TMU01_16590 [Tenuibacillus multivorans]SDN15906.1 hypothetical protein SAMN05216498_1514 [Tenuibacillus multivorans]
MDPISIIEISASIFFVIVIFVIALLLPSKVRKLSLVIAFSLTLLLLLFFAIRPFWVDYQVSVKTEQLNQYLEGKYPNQEWGISREVGRRYNPYDLEVIFEKEQGWTYTYLVVNETNICQVGWSPPEGKFPNEGKYFEDNDCE